MYTKMSSDFNSYLSNSSKETSSDTKTNPVEYMRWSIDKMISKTAPMLQALMYSTNLDPDELECVYKTYLYEQKMMSFVHNISILYNDIPGGDAIAVNIANYDVGHFLTSLTKQTLRIFDNSGIEIFVKCSKNCRYASFDLKLLGFIMYNIISNAIIHNNRKEKVIEINAKTESERVSGKNQKYLKISVKDNGPGINAAKRKTLFVMDNTMLQYDMIEKTGGFMKSVFGLKASYKAARRMDGYIEYLPGKGAEFVISIPQKDEVCGFYESQVAEPQMHELFPIYASALLKLKYNE